MERPGSAKPLQRLAEGSNDAVPFGSLNFKMDAVRGATPTWIVLICQAVYFYFVRRALVV